jgi:CubicO group peptidase (beta-lactamase class C family)
VTEGFTATGYETVAEAFQRNFTERGEVGAAFAAYRNEELVVDLWGGVADPATGRPWQSDTLQLIFSGSAAFRRAGLAAVGAYATARSMARFYACLAAGGALDGVRVLAASTVDLGRRASGDAASRRCGAALSPTPPASN